MIGWKLFPVDIGSGSEIQSKGKVPLNFLSLLLFNMKPRGMIIYYGVKKHQYNQLQPRSNYTDLNLGQSSDVLKWLKVMGT